MGHFTLINFQKSTQIGGILRFIRFFSEANYANGTICDEFASELSRINHFPNMNNVEAEVLMDGSIQVY